MAFIPEDGSGLPDSNSYVDLEYIAAYHAERGNGYWASLAEAATGVCSFSAVPSDGQTVTVGDNEYTFKDTLDLAANSVLIGADVAACIANLVAAINRVFSQAGVSFSVATLMHPDVIAKGDATLLALVAREAGPDANEIDLATTVTGSGWSAATLVGGSVDKQMQCCVRSTDFIEKRFKSRFRGERMQKEQALSFPRLGAFDDDGFTLDGIPSDLKKAQCEYALRAALYNVLAPDGLRNVPSQNFEGEEVSVTPNEQTGSIKSKSVTVGPVKESFTYESMADIIARNSAALSRSTQTNIVNDFIIPEYPEADLLIEPLIQDVGQSTTLGRA